MMPLLAVVGADGRLQFDALHKARMQRHLSDLAGKQVEVVIRQQRKKRSLDQNAWLWGVAYPVIANDLGYDRHELNDLHYALVATWGGTHRDARLGVEVPNKRSSSLTTVEFSDYMDWVVRYAAQEFGIVVPLPNEDAA